MKIVFIAALEEGHHCVKEVHDSGWEIDTVFTLDKSHSNRSAFVDFSDLEKHNFNIVYVDDISSSENVEKLRKIKPEIIVLVGWSFIIPKEIIEIPSKAIIGTHPSLLPKGKGAAPIPWSILLGLKETGISWFYLTERIDSGDIIKQKKLAINLKDNARIVYDKISKLTAEGLLEVLDEIKFNKITINPKNTDVSYYLPPRKPSDGIIDWNKLAFFLYKWIKAHSHPYPGAFTYYNGIKYFVWDCEFLDDDSNSDSNLSKPGEIERINKEGLIVKTGDGRILITHIQMEGSNEINFKGSVDELPDIKAGALFE